MIKTRIIRYTVLTAFLALVIYMALGFGERSFEAYCPFGGMEALWGLFTVGEFSCAMGPTNLSMMVAIVVLALLAKKLFCGWVCPIGFLHELISRLSKLLFKRQVKISPKLNNTLKLLRYPALIIALYFTYKTGELILRGYDPFYIIFSGMGHGTLGTTTWIVLGILIVGAFLVPMFFCRYLCPLGATLDPFSRLGLIKPVRNEATCTSCAKCAKACPHDLQPNKVVVTRFRDCTNCLECIDACPEKDTLTLKIGL